MKRLHVNIAVTELDPTVAFYSSLFAAPPTVLKPDYAKWMLDDPRVNFSVSTRASTKGLDHLGIQVESDDELHEVHDRLKTAGGPILELGETVCCYAKSAKTWISDPDGVAWETFFTTGESAVYGEDTEVLDEL
ncbi:MAG: VOC family protein, partial [Alphaproteobacteria bacterium]|nr:VOC family protein [Alphaproteobacteria bacterium]